MISVREVFGACLVDTLRLRGSWSKHCWFRPVCASSPVVLSVRSWSLIGWVMIQDSAWEVGYWSGGAPSSNEWETWPPHPEDEVCTSLAIRSRAREHGIYWFLGPTVDCEWEDASSLLDGFDDPGEHEFRIEMLCGNAERTRNSSRSIRARHAMLA
ncbi:hypothetical protein BHM03_00005082 [Ensete ventricosum]|nr:hypothetical protein BHM03_00005082 [Ensete ventricosum]